MTDIVKIPDNGLECIIRAKLDLAAEEPITQEAMDSIETIRHSPLTKYFGFINVIIRSLEGIEHARSLKALDICWLNEITDLTPLEKLEKLKSLRIHECQVHDHNEFGKISGLKELELEELRCFFNKLMLPGSLKDSHINYEYFWQKYSILHTLVSSDKKRKLKEFIYNPSRNGAYEILEYSPLFVGFARNFLDESALRDYFASALKDPKKDIRYLDDFLLITPFGEESEDFAIKHGKNGSVEFKNKLMELSLGGCYGNLKSNYSPSQKN